MTHGGDDQASAATSGVRTIDRDELEEKLRHGDPLRLIMALNDWAFRAKHIPGSEHFESSEELRSSVRPDETVIVYCTSVDCHSSIALYEELVAAGYRDVRRYSGGLTDWESAGLPLEGELTTSTAAAPHHRTADRMPHMTLDDEGGSGR